MSLTPKELRDRADKAQPMSTCHNTDYWVPMKKSEAIELADELERLQKSRPVKDGSRLLDLVRYKRHSLHEEGLITNEEFAELANVGSASARRLESYDELAKQLSTYKEALEMAEKALSESHLRDAPSLANIDTALTQVRKAQGKGE